MSWAEDHGYGWVQKETGPRIFVEAVKLLGVRETPGAGDNPTIMQWARSLGFSAAEYPHDSTPWCGLGMAYIASQAGWEPPKDPLWALNWKNFGNPAPLGVAMLGDILVKSRAGGGHVTMYAGEDADCYHCIGCNQSDMVNIVRYPKAVFGYIRRCPWRVNQPAQVRRVWLNSHGAAATKEN